MRISRLICKLIVSSVFLIGHVNGEVTVPKIFSNDMILQRGQRVPVWGTALAGEKISITFNEQIKSTVADTAGKWRVDLDPLNASSTPSVLRISGNNTIEFTNVLVGEVWLCSGQSNMEYTMRKNDKAAKADSSFGVSINELETANNTEIRIFLVTQKNLFGKDSRPAGWAIAKDSALRSFSAAGYFFAKELYDKLQVPIGVISAAIPGSAIEPWLPGKILDEKAQPIVLDQSEPGKFFPKMIQPLAPFAIKGFLWYQGETNCFQNESIEYSFKMKSLIEGWRKLWTNDQLPFYYVQIAPYYYSKSAGKYPLNQETLPKFWEAQTLVMKLPHTGMAVINDLPKSPEDLHPIGKWEVGRRLALWALAKTYDKKIIPSGPVFREMDIMRNRIELEFDYTGKGLINIDGKALKWFTIAGKDGKFVAAEAKIKDDKIIVSSPLVPDPVNVRFAWSEAAQPNFFNKDGLPAVPFRTDNPLLLKKL